jgi:hypothetical protein
MNNITIIIRIHFVVTLFQQSSSVEGAHYISRQHYIGGDHLTQCDIKSQSLDVT